jgi:hypothetical protein
MTNIRSGSTGASSGVQATSLSNNTSAGSVALTAMSTVAGKMAGSISNALNLTNEQSADQWQGNGNDPYEIDEMAEALSKELGGSASDVGELSRALHEFVQESAALFAARPESRSLALLQSIIRDKGEHDTAATLSAVAKQIDAATSELREGSLLAGGL